MTDAEIRFRVNIDDNQATKSLNNMQGLGSKISGGFATAGKKVGKALLTGTAIATTAMVGMVAKSVQKAGELEQQIGGTEAVFGDFANTVQEQGGKAFSSMGLSANDYMATMNKMGALMQGSGIEQKEAMDLSSQAMQRAADVASIMGIDVGSAMESIAGAAKGNFTMMDNLGVAMNATTIESYALRKGIKKSYVEMTKAEQVGLAMEMFLEQSAYATGNYAKENKTFAGSLQTMKASFDNFLAGTGDVEEFIDSLLGFGNILLDSILKMAPKIIQGLGKIAVEITKRLPEFLRIIVNEIPKIMGMIVELLPVILPALIQLTVDLINSLVNMLPTILPVLLTAFIDGFIMIMTSLAKVLPDMMPVIVEAILSLIPVLIDNLPLFIEAGMQLIIGLAVGLIKAVPTLLSYIPNIIASIFNYFKEVPKKALQIGKDLIYGLWNGIKDVTSWLYNKISGFVDGVLGKIKNFFGIKSPSKEFAIIGRYNIEGLEEGMEKEERNLNKTIEATIGSGLDYVSRMGLGGNSLTPAYSMAGSNSINNVFEIGNVSVRNDRDINLIAEQLYYLQKKEVV